MPINDNDLILQRLRGVPMTQVSRLEALLDPTNPNVIEQNDNAEPDLPKPDEN